MLDTRIDIHEQHYLVSSKYPFLPFLYQSTFVVNQEAWSPVGDNKQFFIPLGQLVGGWHIQREMSVAWVTTS